MTSLFVYGTLRDAALVEQLTGRRFASKPAVLRGYRKVSPPDAYAYIVADEAAYVEGLLLHDLDTDSLAAFDRYEGEGDLYRRTAVTVIVDGTPLRAATYVGIPEAHSAMTEYRRPSPDDGN